MMMRVLESSVVVVVQCRVVVSSASVVKGMCTWPKRARMVSITSNCSVSVSVFFVFVSIEGR